MKEALKPDYLEGDKSDRISGCPFQKMRDLGRNDELENTEHKKLIKMLVTLGGVSVKSLLTSRKLEPLHPSEELTVLGAVAIDRFCKEFLACVPEGNKLTLDQLLLLWGEFLLEHKGSDSWFLLEAMDQRQSGFSHRPEWLKEQEGFNSKLPISIALLREGLKTLIIFVDEHEANNVGDSVISDNTCVKAANTLMQSHLLDAAPMDPDPEGILYYGDENISAFAEQNEILVRSTKARIKQFSQKKFLRRFYKRQPELYSDPRRNERFDMDELVNKPRVGCYLLYSGCSRFLMEWALAEIRRRPKIELPDFTEGIMRALGYNG